jgi:hypothetical protein
LVAKDVGQEVVLGSNRLTETRLRDSRKDDRNTATLAPTSTSGQHNWQVKDGRRRVVLKIARATESGIDDRSTGSLTTVIQENLSDDATQFRGCTDDGRTSTGEAIEALGGHAKWSIPGVAKAQVTGFAKWYSTAETTTWRDVAVGCGCGAGHDVAKTVHRVTQISTPETQTTSKATIAPEAALTSTATVTAKHTTQSRTTESATPIPTATKPTAPGAAELASGNRQLWWDRSCWRFWLRLRVFGRNGWALSSGRFRLVLLCSWWL